MNDNARAALAQQHLNDPNFDIEDNLWRSSSERSRSGTPQTAAHPAATIRRRVNAGPPAPLSPPLAHIGTPSNGFPLISSLHSIHNSPTYPSVVQDSNGTHRHVWAVASGSQTHTSDAQDAPRIHIQPPDANPDDYDLESIAQTTTTQRFSRDSYGYEKKGTARSFDDMEMDARSAMEFEE